MKTYGLLKPGEKNPEYPTSEDMALPIMGS